jgi:hypothetical protein
MKVDEPFSHGGGPGRSIQFRKTFVPGSWRQGGGAFQDFNMGLIGKKRDQGEEQGGKHGDPALTVKSLNRRSQPKS